LFLEISQMKYENEVLPEGSIIMVAVNEHNVPDEYRKFTEHITTSDLLNNNVFVKVRILKPLLLQLRGSKKAILMETECEIPSLKNEKANSINTAYTMISERFEPKRRSHTGNVFSKCYYYDPNESKWFPLEELREAEEASFEGQLFLDFKVFTLNPSYDKAIVFNEDEKLLMNSLDNNGQITGQKIKEIFNNDRSQYIRVIWSLTDKEVIEEIHS
jgi:hypothetical protein